jgi:hypothetical protein
MASSKRSGEEMMKRIGIWMTFGLLLFGLVACSGGAAEADVYEGHFIFGFETSSFEPCGQEEAWWVVGESLTELTQAYSDISPESYNPVFVRLRGEISKSGQYGHLGAYTREFQVLEVLEVRQADPQDCQPDEADS